MLHFAVCAAASLLTAVVMALLYKDFLIAAVDGFAFGIAIGIGKEYGDSKAPNNKWDWYDLLADALGAIFGSLVGGLLAYML